jgi:hypothetical protein
MQDVLQQYVALKRRFWDYDPARTVASMMHSATEVFLMCYFVLNGFNFFRAFTYGMVSYGRCKTVVFGSVAVV